jgi:hypothetical protein
VPTRAAQIAITVTGADTAETTVVTGSAASFGINFFTEEFFLIDFETNPKGWM